jgi:hypothetical protein
MSSQFAWPLQRRARLLVGLVALIMVFAMGGFVGPTIAAQVQQVLVINSSASPVPVTGTVNVGNLPATQPVSGTVSVGNFPATQNVNVTGGTVTAAQKVSTVMTSTGFHEVAFLADDVLSFGAAGLNVTGIAINDGLAEQDSWRLNVFGQFGGVIKVASASGNVFLPLSVPIAASSIHAQCLSEAGCFWNIQAIGYPTP